MQQLLGWSLIILGGGLYIAQVISSLNFPMAQRLGLQEKPETSAKLLQRSEQYTAYWDLLTLPWLPLGGLLMVTNHQWWPIVSLIGGSIYLDASGREAAKSLSFRHEGLQMGNPTEQRVYSASYVVMALTALIVIGYALRALSELI